MEWGAQNLYWSRLGKRREMNEAAVTTDNAFKRGCGEGERPVARGPDRHDVGSRQVVLFCFFKVQVIQTGFLSGSSDPVKGE